MNASVSIQIVPKSTEDKEVIRIVDAVIDYIRSTGLTYYVGPTETAIEGDFDRLMQVIRECHTVAVAAGAAGISSYIKINYRPEGDVLTIDEKVTKHHK